MSKNIWPRKTQIQIDFSEHTRLDLIEFAISITNANNYLEIGCLENFVFDKVNVKHKIGVDPRQGGNLRMHSDDFFKSNTEKFDVIFIDGDHEYQQVKRDVYNSINCITDKGWIIIHDVLPTSRKDTVVSNHGDAWRVSFDLLKETKLCYKIVKIDWGCGLILPGTQNTKKIKLKRKNIPVSWNYYIKYFDKLPIITFNELKEIVN